MDVLGRGYALTCKKLVSLRMQWAIEPRNSSNISDYSDNVENSDPDSRVCIVTLRQMA